ncbi:serine hydrolase domain-containing protein [Flavobacterium johnsoniae]|uniref:Beta-lactamase n=1 Tax=Flavobacterium johnsoniae (strain ATCC 17061 / DSM 2064 / JCM 8514 / BCRC 14874 / CCUG 350202 / NBRC 14942 / NCIMB 11054 / UW101) TaxID=376686 RepID=A5FAG4_FLAJ1|nr:serine hydrolase [Flavobacterium johnsoniae]ABQ07806.1 beta-lactamase [Flavobacterium johnsoniae UW101]OXG01887.1 serine hydrolase [Flavobacterium johnsoniae UW101]WQG80351.1 serine hydrolase [Flavobacterium johnsoniae UW101]SHL01306.1 CubicO group peptidase, beta-lactamase class C family [Flavobacterium johnsoniae]
MKKITAGIILISMTFLGINAYSQKKSKKSFDVKRNEVYIDSMMTNALEKGFFPGAQIIVGNKDAVLISKNYGFQDYSKKQPVKSDDVYDLASMSKVLGATLVTMRLVGEDKIKLTDKVGDLVEVYKNTPIADLTFFELLTHTSGLKASITFYQSLLSTPDGLPLLSKEKSDVYPDLFDTMYVNKNIVYDANYLSFTPKENWVQIYKNMWLNPEFYKTVYEQISTANTNTRGKYVYSDLNLLLVKQMIEAKTGLKLDELTKEIYTELGISKIGYNPLKWTSLENVTPTELDNFFRKDTIRGYVHDEAAAIFGGVSGNAGLFANAQSISVICQMLLNDGKYQGKEILKATVVKEFTSSPLTKEGIYRGLGFDKRKPDEFFKANDFGHTGFTGTFFFMNPDTNRFLIILTNRVNPTRTNRLMYKDDFSAKIWRQINN